jgi:hypothetical protein
MASRKSPATPMSVDEKRWRARSDADTLAAAEEIKADRARITAAKAYAGKEAQRYEKVAKGSSK